MWLPIWVFDGNGFTMVCLAIWMLPADTRQSAKEQLNRPTIFWARSATAGRPAEDHRASLPVRRVFVTRGLARRLPVSHTDKAFGPQGVIAVALHPFAPFGPRASVGQLDGGRLPAGK